MSRLVLHIGMHKTGTTSIQKFFHRNNNGENYTYLKMGEGNHGGAIVSLFEPFPERVHMHKEAKRSKEEINIFNKKTEELLIDQIQKNTNENFIISGEGIIDISTDGLKNFKSFLDKNFDQIKVIAYIRSPHSYMSSIFQQAVKRGTEKEFNFEKYYPNYKTKLFRFDSIFGQENVIYKPFNRKLLKNGNVVNDFIHEFDLKGTYHDQIQNENESISLELFSLLYFYNRYTIHKRKRPGKIIKNLSILNNREKVNLSTHITEKILQSKDEDISWIENRMHYQFNEIVNNKGISSEEDILQTALAQFSILEKLIDKTYTEKTVKNLVQMLDIIAR